MPQAVREIGAMSLNNKGGFVANIQFAYFDDNGKRKLTTKKSGDIPLSQTKEADPGDLGIPDEALCYMYAYVALGKSNQAPEVFLYSKGDPAVAEYEIKGTTLDNTLTFTRVS